MATVEEGVQTYVDTINRAVTAANLTRPEDSMLKWRETSKYYKIERESIVMPDGESCLPAMLHLTANYHEH